MQVDLREFRAAYLAEVDEHLRAMRALLVALDEAARARRPAPRELRELMRVLHTVKGLSAMVGVEPIVALAHAMETAVRAADRAAATVDERAVDALVRAARCIEGCVNAVAADRLVVAAPAELLAELDALPAAAPAGEDATAALPLDPALGDKLTPADRAHLADAAASGRRVVRIDFIPSPAKAEGGLTITTVRERLSKLAEIVKVVPLATAPSDAAPSGLVFAILVVTDASNEALAEAGGGAPADVRSVLDARAPGADAPAGASPADEGADAYADAAPAGRAVLRVEVARVDDAIDKLSALIVTRFRLQRAVDALTAAGAPTAELVAILAENARQLRDMRAAILRVRMVPVASILERLPLLVRGLAKAAGKDVELVAEPGGAEVDKVVAERLFPAVVHLLRNAVDHGVELPKDRLRDGKTPHATVRVACAARDRTLEIRVEDDGRGVDRDAVAKATAAAAPPDDDDALLDMICASGVTTRGTADATSGRGMGMDIVRRVVSELGGELALRTERGRGTTFIVRVPLTIAIVDGFVAFSAGERFVVPVGAVEAIVELDDAALLMAGTASRGGSRGLLAHRGETIPVVDLADALDLPRPPGEPTRAAHAVVVRRKQDGAVAFALDRVVSREEAVIRPLADPLVRVPGVSASTDLGDGRATLVLDLGALVARLDGSARGRRPPLLGARTEGAA